MFNQDSSSYFLVGRSFLIKQDLYLKPCASSLLDIYSVSQLSEQNTWPISMINKKMFFYEIPHKNGWCATFPLLHSDRTEVSSIQ